MALIGKTVYNKTGETVLFEGSYNPMSAIAQDLLDDLISYGVTEISETIGGPSIDHEAGIDAFDDIVYDVTPEPAPVYPETIAGQISRLQDAKACIKAAIEEKGVTIGSDVTLDGYAGCIGEISSGDVARYADILVVGGGGNGGSYGGGGGGGGIIHRAHGFIDFLDVNNTACVIVGGAAQDSCLGPLKACRGGNGGDNNCYDGYMGGSGGGALNYTYCSKVGGANYSCDLLIQGNRGGETANRCGSCCCQYSGGGGGAGGSGYKGGDGARGNGGPGCQYDITGISTYYSAGGGGGGESRCVRGYITRASGGTGGGGSGGTRDSKYGCEQSATAPTTYGSGGGGGYGPSCGCKGIVVIRYHTDGSDGITSATGGCKYTCGDYTIHCFTSNGTFCITG